MMERGRCGKAGKRAFLGIRVSFFFALLCVSVNSMPGQQSSSAASGAAGEADLPALRALIDKGHVTEALRQLDLLAARHPEPAGVERLRGVAFYAQNKFPEADRALATALQQDSKDVEAAEMRGLTLFRLGRSAEAIPVLEGLHTWSPNTKVDPSYVLALCYIDVRRYDDARHAFARQYGFEPDSAAAYQLAGRMLLRREVLPPAQQFARKAVELNPNLPLTHQLLGEISLANQQLAEAVTEFEKERALNPLYGGIYDRLGDAYTRSGDYQKAQQALEQAMLLEPNSTGPFILMGKVLLKRQDPAGATSYLERAARMDPSNFMTHSLLGQAYRMMGRTEDADREAALGQRLQSGGRSVQDPAR
ncbi:MAG TPA: tetratricopeptide repeat protein [Acidisarcina sp.]|nr:tetratricopeptide repeat protein [Acidisarcina sp.]